LWVRCLVSIGPFFRAKRFKLASVTAKPLTPTAAFWRERAAALLARDAIAMVKAGRLGGAIALTN
jgi:hypothetical protein